MIRPAPGDVLLGHPSRYGENIFDRSFREPGWARRIVFCPFSHAMPRDAAMIDGLVEQADFYLALCGPYWFDTADTSLLSHWRYKMMRCDLGLERGDYPLVKTDFNPPGRRRFLYIGNAGPMKGVDYFCTLAEANSGLSFSWIGWPGLEQRPAGTLRGEYAPLENRLRSGPIRVLGGADWRVQSSLSLVAEHDFLLTCGRSDSNPTTILETSAWGLVPVAPLQCGYYGDDWLVNIPLDDLAGTSQILRWLNTCPQAELAARQKTGLERLDTHFTWDHAARQVMACIEAPLPIAPASPQWLETKYRNRAALKQIARSYRRDQTLEDAWHGMVEAPARFVRHARLRARRAIAGAGR